MFLLADEIKCLPLELSERLKHVFFGIWVTSRNKIKAFLGWFLFCFLKGQKLRATLSL